MIILASTSPRRKQLLEWAEIPFEVVTYPTDEVVPENVPLTEVPVHIAREKALAVKTKVDELVSRKRLPANLPVLAADTIVLLNNEILGKPDNRGHAIEMLSKLQGKSHQVVTGVVLLDGEREVAFSDISDVEFHPLTEDQITFYVDKYKPYDKAGAYAIQEWIGVVGIKAVKGDFYNVMGLPVSRVVQAIENW